MRPRAEVQLIEGSADRPGPSHVRRRLTVDGRAQVGSRAEGRDICEGNGGEPPAFAAPPAMPTWRNQEVDLDEKAIRVLLDITEAVADVLRRHLPETEEANATEADLGARVRRLRKWRDFSQADLAERVGVDTSTICRIERSDRKSLTKYAHAIAKALHTTPEV